MFEGLFQPMHLLVILIFALLIFGPQKLPELGKGLGEGIRGGRTPKHPLPVTGAIETSRGVKRKPPPDNPMQM